MSLLKNETYVLFLESLVLSLLHERKSDNDIICVDDILPGFPLRGATFSTYNVKEQIAGQRQRREEIPS